jgi:hypothetical protein
MRRLILGLALSMLATTVLGLAAEKAYQKGKYLDVDSQAYQKNVGDMIDVRIDKNYMYLRKPDGGEVKTRIVRRVRVN